MTETIDQWAGRLKLNASSPTTQQLYTNRHLTVNSLIILLERMMPAAYVSKFRRGQLNRVIPAEARELSVEEALHQKLVGGVNVRKLLESNRAKFRK